MKTNKILLGLLAIGTLLVSSCDKYLDINDNPNAPQEGHMTEKVYLPGVLAQASYCGLEQGNYYQVHWMLQIANNSSSPGGAENLLLRPADFNNNWEIYKFPISNTVLLNRLAAKNKNFWYQGISEVVLAHQFSLLTDMFGDIPYTDAIKFGEGVLQPKFDQQEKIYPQLIELLDKAIANLSTPENTQKWVGDDDLIFGGDTEKWIKFAHSLKARLYLRMVYRDKAYAQKALDEVKFGIVDNSDNAQFAYGTASKSENFWYQYSQNWANPRKLYPSKFFVNMLNGLDDPRRAIMFTKTGIVPSYIGIVNGTSLSASEEKKVSHFSASFNAPDKPSVFISASEMLFVKAEALLLTGASVVDVQNALNDAVIADMKSLNVSDSDFSSYLAKNELNLSLVSSTEARQKIIITQKYIALFMENSEPYNDWRRTGYPIITEDDWKACLTSGSASHYTAPNRFPYCATVLERNVNTPLNVDVWTAKVWWDNKDKANLAK